MGYRLSKDDVKAQARGRWLEIFAALASPAIDNAVANIGRGVPCPKGTGSTDGFRLPTGTNEDGHAFHNQVDNKRLSDGIGLLMWLNDWSFYEALEEVNKYLGGETGRNQQYRAQPAPPESDTWKKTAKACTGILKRATTGFNAPAMAYLKNRGLDHADIIKSPSLLSHAGIQVMHGGKGLTESGKWVTVPALVGRVSSSNGWLGLNITRITKDGLKAGEYMASEIERLTGTRPEGLRDKQLLKSAPSMRGGAVRFGHAKEVYCAGEGLETMLSVALALGTTSAAAAGTAALLERLEVPDRVKRLLIFADKDLTGRGEEAADNLMKRMQGGMDVEILLPPSPVPAGHKGIDWLDDIKNLGSEKISLLGN